MNQKNKMVAGIVGVLLLVIGFFGGVHYQKGKTTSMFANRTGGLAGRTGGQFGGTPGARGGMGGGFTAGEIMTNDGKTMTIKLQDGGSKIVLLGDTTKVAKTVDGTSADLKVGTQVTITGAANADGSVTASGVQIRPASMVK